MPKESREENQEWGDDHFYMENPNKGRSNQTRGPAPDSLLH